MADYNVYCSRCKKEFQRGPANSVLYIWKDRRYCSFAESTCHCGTDTRNFVDEEELREMLVRDYPFVEAVNCPPQLVKEWERVNDIELLQPLELLPRHNELIERLGFILVNTPDADLMDIFSEPPPTSDLPIRWC